MKKLVILFFLFVSFFGNSQGNLQFNQAKLVTSVETVPTGKVWKIENASHNGGAPFCVSSNESGYCGSSAVNTKNFGIMSFEINGLLNIISIYQTGGGVTSITSPFPFWLPAGSTLKASTNIKYLSVIEFNIVP